MVGHSLPRGQGLGALQKLVEAKLKRAWLEGVADRASRHSQGQPAPDASFAADAATPQHEDEDASVALADANMAALLEEVELEDEECAPYTPPALCSLLRYCTKQPPCVTLCGSDGVVAGCSVWVCVNSRECFTPTWLMALVL